MSKNKFKLIIWDFDGVIADSEKVWLKNRQKILNEKYGAGWSFETANQHIGGMSDKTKIGVLKNLGIVVDENFEKDCMEMDLKDIHTITSMPNVEKILDDKKIKQCVATGGVYTKTLKKISAIGFERYFNDNNIFTADMVKHGKPEPELFLLAAEKMGEESHNCIVIEDSIPGMKAGILAGMKVIAFLGSEMCQNENFLLEVKKLGITDIFYDMIDVKSFLDDNI